MKKVIIPISVLFAGSLLYWALRKPTISIIGIDWHNGTLEYDIRYWNHSMRGTKKLTDKTTTSKNFGKNSFLFASSEGNKILVGYSIDGKVQSKYADFSNQTHSEL